MIDLQTAYDSCGHGIIKACVAKFHRHFGGDPDDLLSEAQWCFIKAVQTWDPSKGTLKGRISHCVWWGLFEIWRRKVSRDMKLHRIDMDQTSLETLPCKDHADLWGKLQEAGDAATVAQLAVDARSRTKPRKRRAVMETLTDLGWESDRIFRAATDLREALR